MLDRRQELVLYYRECDSVANNIIGGSEQRKRKESMSVRCPAAPNRDDAALSLSSRLAAREDAVKPDGRSCHGLQEWWLFTPSSVA